jgi:uncharacterized protein YbjT (DUF2867 family)
MKIIITGSLGHISKPLAIALIEKGHAVTVISSKADKQKDIEALGATAAIGILEDVDFLTNAFTGADAVYCMVPPNDYFNHQLDLMAFYHEVGNNYAQAIRQSGIKRVVHLSSIGAHMNKDSGIILGHRWIEDTLAAVPGIGITHMRPTYFYYNLFPFVNMIKKAGFIAANYGGDDKVVMVAPVDIAAAIAEEIVTPLAGRKIRYVASDERSCNEIASVLGAAIGKPDLQWKLISNEQSQQNLEAVGMSPKIAAGLIEMYASLHNGALSADYYLHQPAVMGKVKLADFAKDFAAAYNK